jgi:hypothetical protein
MDGAMPRAKRRQVPPTEDWVQLRHFGETLILEYAEEALAQYRVELEPDDEHFRAISEPRLFAHRFPTAQPMPWALDEGKWHLVLRLPPRQLRRAQRADAPHAEQAVLFSM